MQKTCTNCTTSFEITEDDLAFYNKVSPEFGGKKYQITPPTLCPICRAQRRLTFRNFFNLYHRTCDLTDENILSMYDKDAPFPVYEMHDWWSDKWDALDYGRAFDSKRPFFEQLQELHNVVPRMNMMNTLCENTNYCNLSRNSNNCYLVFGNIGNEDCCYGHIVWQSTDCLDCLYIYKCERCYECVDCVECYGIRYSRACENCHDAQFLVHCTGCKNCFGCVGLKNKEYCLFNEQLTKEEYEHRMGEFRCGSHQLVEMARSRVQKLIGTEVVKHYHGVNCENVTGDYLYNCKNVFDSYDAKNCEDCRHCATVESFVDVYDSNYSPDRTELSLENVFVVGHHLLFCHNVMNESSNMLYCDHCFGCKDCFGCAGLRNKSYCIFNKEYSKEKYEDLVPKIIEHMQKAGEWGEYFPMSLSPFAYNETIAQEYSPLEKDDALKKGWEWHEESESNEDYMGPPQKVPDDIKDVPDDICDQVLLCEVTKKPYKIIPKELEFLKEMDLPLPRKCFTERHKRRMALRNPRKLWERTCNKCQKGIQTTYAPERPEVVYCEECYLSEVY